MDKMRALRYFKRVAELKSFSLAAQEFSVPSSSISRRIKDLESILGLELLKRSTRIVELTELGSLYYDMIIEGLEKLDDADELMMQRMSTPEGILRISAMPSYGEQILSPILEKFQQDHPLITLDLDYSDSLTVLGKDPIDIAIRSGFAPDERVVAKQLSKNNFKLVASPKLLYSLQLLYNKEVLSFQDLEHCPTLQHRVASGALPWWVNENSHWRKIAINPVVICNNGKTLLNAALTDRGLMLAPSWGVDKYIESGELVEVATDFPINITQRADAGIFILYQRSKYQISKVKLCIDFIMHQLNID
ncbi:LysR family transcriptional regulator [Vibrio anguillarum]|nr:LysR family transcriptional regulator [Vibrio anguillarum]